MPDIIWNYGGGTQSIGMWVLIEQGRLPMPEVIIMADTGREASEVWEYHEQHIAPRMATMGCELIVIPHDWAIYDIVDSKGKILLPVYTNDGEGRMPSFCSANWKRDVVQKFLTKEMGYGPKNPIIQWLGYSLDEKYRLKKKARRKWITLDYPLLAFPNKTVEDTRYHVRLRRNEVINLVQEAGLPEPPRSACWMCPQRSNLEWKHLKDQNDGDWEKAIAMDEELRQYDIAQGRDPVYLHRSYKPLSEADLEAVVTPDLFDCDQTACFC